MKEKRGFSHIEVVLAFIIFVGFLIFALYFFNPLNNTRVLESSLIYAFDEINENLTVVLESYSISVDLSFGAIVGIPIDDANSNNVRVEDYDGNVLPSSFASGVVTVDRGTEKFLVILFSEDFENGGASGGTLLNDLNFNISSSNSKEVISENSAMELNDSYFSDYRGLKDKFNLPGRIDFGFALVMDDSKIVAENSIPENIEVVVQEDRVEVIRIDGRVEFADLRVKIW